MEPENDQDVSFEQDIPRDLRKSRRSHAQRHTFSKAGVGLGFPPYRVVIFCLGLLDIALLITALVLGMYCANARDFKEVSDPALAPLIIERDFLLNHSDVIKQSLGTHVEVEKQRKARLQLQIQVKKQQTITDSLQSHIQALRVDKSQLESNRTALEVNCARCPDGWVLLKTSCYFYANNPSSDRKNWDDSRADCVKRGGDLLVINNLEEQKTINHNIPKLRYYQNPIQIRGFWIGLTDRQTNGVWTWVNNATDENTMYWPTGQPNYDASLNGHCVALARNILSWKSWFNRNCDNEELDWICEMKPL